MFSRILNFSRKNCLFDMNYINTVHLGDRLEEKSYSLKYKTKYLLWAYKVTYSEKAAKVCEISTVDLTVTT